MSSSKRKLFTSIVSFALVAVIGVGAIIAVFAALVAHVDSGFNISYTASNVECIVTGTYSQRYGLRDQTLGAPIVFTAEAPDNDTREFDVIPNVEFENSEDYLEFHFTIQNTGKNGFNVSLLLTGLDDHFKIEYTKSARASGDTTPKFDFSKNVRSKLVDSYVTANGSAKEYLDIGIRVSLLGKPEESAKSTGSFDFTLNGLAERPADIWDDGLQKFDKENFENMLKLISADGDASAANMDTINRLATEVTDAAEIFNSVGGIKKQGNVVVTLGGLTWHACYLSKDKNDNDILTLWLTSCEQNAWQGLPADEGAYYGFVDGGLYSDWSANQTLGGSSATYPSAMYGTSYVRAVTLNNGGEYAISNTKLDSYTKTTENIFALFTMEDFGLTKYIVPPRQVSWQESGQFAMDILGYSNNLSNENWSSEIPDDGFDSPDNNFAHREKNDVWADDFLWLPSLTEVGYTSGILGLWQLRVGDRKNNTTAPYGSESVGNMNDSNAAHYADSWLRSCSPATNYQAYRLGLSGGADYTYGVSGAMAIRPALHLNLTAAARALNG